MLINLPKLKDIEKNRIVLDFVVDKKLNTIIKLNKDHALNYCQIWGLKSNRLSRHLPKPKYTASLILATDVVTAASTNTTATIIITTITTKNIHLRLNQSYYPEPLLPFQIPLSKVKIFPILHHTIHCPFHRHHNHNYISQ